MRGEDEFNVGEIEPATRRVSVEVEDFLVLTALPDFLGQHVRITSHSISAHGEGSTRPVLCVDPATDGIC